MNLSPNLLFFLPGSNAYTLKMLLPEGFQQTGGNLTEFVTGELAYPAQSEVTYSIRGIFTSTTSNACFRLLRSHGHANNQSLFVEKATLCIPVRSRQESGAARSAMANSLVNWCVEAESGSSNRSVSSNNLASGGQCIGGFGNSSEYADYTITGVPSAGNYTLHIWYTSGENPQFGIVINGNLQTASGTSNGSWTGPFVEKTVAVSLQAGNNSLRIQGGGSGNFTLDRLCVDGGDGGSGCTPPSLSLGTPTCNGSNTYSVSFITQAGANVSSSAGSVQGNQVVNIPTGTNVTVSSNLNGCSSQQTAYSPSCSPGNNPTGCGTGNGLTGTYYNTGDLSQNPAATRTDAQINFVWNDSPMPGALNTDFFSVRWQGQVEAPISGTYTFKTYNDDATRLWINGQQLINDWNGHAPTWQQGSIYLNAGQKYDLKLEFAEFTGGAQAQLYWEVPGQSLELLPSCRLYTQGGSTNPPTSSCGAGTGLTGYYSNGTIFANAPVKVRTDASINFSWGSSPIPGFINDDNFNVYWAGQIEAPVSGNYTFKTNNDDGTRLYINGQLIIDDWNSHGPTWQQGSINLTGGQRYRIELFYYDNVAGAQAQLQWEYPGQSTQLVPTCRLYPTTANAREGYNFDAGRNCMIERYQLGCTIFEVCNGEVLHMYKEYSCNNPDNNPPSGHDGDGDPVSPYPYNPGGNTPPNLGGGTPPSYTGPSYASKLIDFYRRARYYDVLFTDDEKALLAVNQELGEGVMSYTDRVQQHPPIDVLLFRTQLNIADYSGLAQAPFSYNPGLPILTGMNYLFAVSREYSVLKIQNTSWSDYKLLLVACKNVSSNTVHFILDVAGIVPGAGEVADAINGGIYVLEGDATNAALSFAATVPFAGWAATTNKWARNVLRFDGAGAFVSKNGLEFTVMGRGAGQENRIDHVRKHLSNDLLKAGGIHGVFNGSMSDVISGLDEAWEQIRKGNFTTVTTSRSPVYVVDMGRVVGWQGGANGSKEALTKIGIIVQPGTSKIVTGYPIK